MLTSLEQVAHDHYHNIDFTLRLDGNQTIVSAIKNGYYESRSAYIDMTTSLSADGKGIDVHLEHVCRQADIDFVLEVELDPDVYEKQTVLQGGSITAPADHSNGGLHTGIFDDGTLYGITLTMPAVEIDRRKSTMTFQTGGAEGSAPNAIQQLIGTTVTIPDGEGLKQPGSSFGGWNVVSGPNTGTHYNAGQIIPMPAGDMTLQPAWGHVEVELELGSVKGPEKPGNQMAEDAKWRYYDRHGRDYRGRLFFNDIVTDSGTTISTEDIVSFSVIDQLVTYEKIVDEKDADRVKPTNIPNAVYARHVGATEQDKVVAYLVPSQTISGKYEEYVAGPGGAKAPRNSSYFLGKSVNENILPFQSISLSALDTSGVQNMFRMFAGCGNITSLDLSNFDTSNVTDMGAI